MKWNRGFMGILTLLWGLRDQNTIGLQFRMQKKPNEGISKYQFGEVTRTSECLRWTKLFTQCLLHLDVFPSSNTFLVLFTVHIGIKSRTTGKLLEGQKSQKWSGRSLLSQTINWQSYSSHACLIMEKELLLIFLYLLSQASWYSVSWKFWWEMQPQTQEASPDKTTLEAGRHFQV